MQTTKATDGGSARAQPVADAATWAAGPPDSELTFSLRHLVFTQITGRVARWKANGFIDLEVPARSWVDVVVDAASLETGDVERDEHVRSVEFLDVRAFPEIRFHGRDVRARGDGRRWSVAGDLTIRHITRPITVELELDDPVGGLSPEAVVLALRGRAVLDRQEFDLRWNQDLDHRGVVVGNAVEITLRVLAHRVTKDD